MADLNFLGKSEDVSREPLHMSAVGALASLASGAAIVITIFSIIAMGGLVLYYRYQTTYMGDLLAQKKSIEDDLRPELINRLVFVDSILTQVRQLLQAHTNTSNVFDFLEKNTHINSLLSAAVLSTDARKIAIDVFVPSYLVFSEQVKLLEAAPFVEKVSFESPSVSEEGIRFKVTIVFKPEIFQRTP